LKPAHKDEAGKLADFFVQPCRTSSRPWVSPPFQPLNLDAIMSLLYLNFDQDRAVASSTACQALTAGLVTQICLRLAGLPHVDPFPSTTLEELRLQPWQPCSEQSTFVLVGLRPAFLLAAVQHFLGGPPAGQCACAIGKATWSGWIAAAPLQYALEAVGGDADALIA
jgi:hypothetical protein